MCENRASHEQLVYKDGVLSAATDLIRSGAISFFPPTGRDETLPYIQINPDNAVRCLSRLPIPLATRFSAVEESNVKAAVSMTERIVGQATHVPASVNNCTRDQSFFAHEYMPDGTIRLGSRIVNDADELQQQLAVDSDQRGKVEICAAALGIGHELGHNVAIKPTVVTILSASTPRQHPIVNAFTEWFLFSGAYSDDRLREEQFATGVGYLAASIAAQDLHLVADWNAMAEKLIAVDRRILPQFSDLISLLRDRNGNPFSLSIGLSQLQATLQKTHPELAQKVPQLGPYYIGYYTAIDPARIIQIFKN